MVQGSPIERGLTAEGLLLGAVRHRGVITLTLALLASIEPASAAHAGQLPDFEVSPEPVTGPVAAGPSAYPEGVRALFGVPYVQWPGFRPLTLDLYLPPPAAEPAERGFPLVIFVHGGSWERGDPRRLGALRDFPQVLAALAARGYVVASVSYRLSGEARFPAAAIDVRAAMRWLRSQQRYRVDPTRTIFWGASAGAHLAALTATACADPAFDPEASPPAHSNDPPGPGPCVQGVVAWYGIFDFATIADQARASSNMGSLPHDAPDAPEWRMLGCVMESCGARLPLASPVSHVNPRSPPMLLIAGMGDRIVPVEQSIQMAARLREVGVDYDLLLMPGVDHSFIGATPSATREATLRALRATFAFIDRSVSSR